MKHWLWIVCLCFSVTSPAQQSWFELVTQEKTYAEILHDCEQYFSITGKGRGTGFKQYMRWRYIMDARASMDGRIENYGLLNKTAYEAERKSASNARATAGDWENIGPFDYTTSNSWSGGGMGRLNCMAFHPTDDETFWVGAAAGGLWFTDDGGMTWEPRTDGFPSIGISGIAVHPVNPDTMYILTGDGDGKDAASIGLLKTVDGGLKWNYTDLQFGVDEGTYGYTLRMHPTNPNILFVGLDNKGLYRLTSGGNSLNQEIGNDTTVWDIEFVPNDPNKMYAATSKGLMRSLNGGTTWFIDNDSDFPTVYQRMAIAVSPSQPSNLYALFGGDTNVNGTFRGMFKSTNQGADFSMQSTTPNILGSSSSGDNGSDQADYDLAIIVDPNQDARVFIGGINIWKSENSGTSWTRLTWWRRDEEPVNPYVHADQHNFYFNAGALYITNDGGLYRSDDLGGEYTELSAGLAIGQFYQIALNNEKYMGGMQDNGTMEADITNPQCHEIEGGDGFGCTWHTGDNSIQYLSTQSSVVRRQFGSNIYIWEEENGFWHNEIEMHKTNPDYFFVCKYHDLYRSHQVGGVTDFEWEDLNTDSLLGANIRSFAQSTSNPNIMYVVSSEGVIKTTNLSASVPTWLLLPDPTGTDISVSDVIIDPANSNRVWVTNFGYEAGEKVFYSDDGGASWENISGSIQNVPIRCIAYTGGTYPGVYIGTEIGVYYRGNGMSDWVSFSNYFPNTIVSDIEIKDGYVYAGTFGRGIWRSPLYSPCPVNVLLTPGNDPGSPYFTGMQHFFASNSLISTRVVPNSVGTHITYSAGSRTDLLVGFRAEAGCFLEVNMDGCPD